MGLKDLFKFRRKKSEENQAPAEGMTDEEMSELWTHCPSCKSMIYNSDLKDNLMVCPKCEHHFRINAYTRIEQIVDPNSWEEIASSVRTANPLEFSDLKTYNEALQQARKKSETSEAIITGVAKIDEQPLALGVMEFAFLGGSMGSVVGERIARLCETAIEKKIPLILVASSGGARMHEGLFSLMQMAKTASALESLRKNKLLYISILTDPTYGGVSASFATLGDIIIAEPKAKIGFAGPRVIEETIRQKLPKDFQTAEYLLEHGQIDLVVKRAELKQQISTLIKMHSMPKASAVRVKSSTKVIAK
jgi:acetyl-CoA carboxylase carboxyl transferase subunit beta